MPTKEAQKFYHPKSEEGRYLNADEVIDHIKIPENPDRIPHILGLAGPGRCGSTALLFLLAGHPLVNRAYYQPLKTIIRNGGPDFTLYEDDELAYVKEVYGPRDDQEYYDPADILSRAGVPFERMTFILMLRKPKPSFASWYAFTGDDSNPSLFAKAQRHTIELFEKYRREGLNVIPFVYELLAEGEEKVLRRLLQRTGFSLDPLNLDFDLESLGVTAEGEYNHLNRRSKMIWGEALSPDHWEAVVKPIVSSRRYRYTTNDEKEKNLPENLKNEVEALCQADYLAYLDLSRSELGF